MAVSQGINKINKFSINQIYSNSIESSDFVFNDNVESEEFGTILSFNIPDDDFSLNDIDSTLVFFSCVCEKIFNE